MRIWRAPPNLTPASTNFAPPLFQAATTGPQSTNELNIIVKVSWPYCLIVCVLNSMLWPFLGATMARLEQVVGVVTIEVAALKEGLALARSVQCNQLNV